MPIFQKPSPDKKTGDTQSTSKIQIGETTVVLQEQILFETQLRKITNLIHSAPNVEAILLGIRDEIVGLLRVDKVTIYALSEDGKEIYSKAKVQDQISEIKVPINNHSIAGYVANTRTLLNIKDAYDHEELKAIDRDLEFRRDFDLQSGFRTQQVLTVPICHKSQLMGVLQIINKKKGDSFTDQDIYVAAAIAEALAIAFYNRARSQSKAFSKFDLLVTENLILTRELEQAIIASRELKLSLEQTLIAQFKVKKADVGRALENFFNVPFYEFRPGLRIPVELMGKLTAEYLRNNLWVPLGKDGNNVAIAIDNPRDLAKRDDITRQIPAAGYKFLVGIPEDILKTIDYFWGASTEIKQSPDDLQLQGLRDEFQEVEDEGEEKEGEIDSVVIRAVHQVIVDAHRMGASDIHIEPSLKRKEVIIRTRVDGDCSIVQRLPLATRHAVVARIKIMAGLDIAEHRKPQDGKIKFKKFGGPDIELRVATIPTVGGNEDVVLRILAASEPIPLDKIGMLERNLAEFKKILAYPYGLVLVVGPTGSGKTTTLHSALGHLNNPDIKIWTAEDPVEITQDGLRQVQVAPKIDFTFAAAMRAFLRADPDVIMVGEMRDYETASIGIEASLTGHLVLSTLHTNSAPETIVRLLDMGLDPFHFSDALLGILAQRLVRTLCKDCKTAYHPGREMFDELMQERTSTSAHDKDIVYSVDLALYAARGCTTCKNTGYKGRMGIHEILVAGDEVKRMIQRRDTAENIRNKAIEEGMTTLKQDGISKVFMGLTDINQVRAVCIK